MIGLLANGIFSASYIIGLDGVNANAELNPGGWILHHWSQLYKQFAYIVAVTAWSFVISAILAFIINLIPGLHLRASGEAELLGMDDDQLGEFAYDYVEVRRDYLAWTPALADPTEATGVRPETMYGIPLHSHIASGGSGENGHVNGAGAKAHEAVQTNGNATYVPEEVSVLHHSEGEKSIGEKSEKRD
jgi:ammonium transporter, Amt family